MNTETSPKKVIEFEDAPSGYITFYNYKEPFMKFEGGYGFWGVLAHDPKYDKIQCHLCGQWFDSLQNHLKREHAMNSAEYKDKVGLYKKTVLINERIRKALIESGQRNNHKNSFKNHVYVVSDETKDKIRKTLSKNQMEHKNQWGTCPLQLIDRLKELYNKLGRVPKSHEINFRETLVKVYGSMEAAWSLAGITPRKCTEKVFGWESKKYPLEVCVNFLRKFWDENKRIPMYREAPSMMNAIKKYGKNLVFTEAFTNDGVYRAQLKFRYTDDVLLMFMRNFKISNGREPSASDTKRKLLPTFTTYCNHFGSWKKAKKLAFNI